MRTARIVASVGGGAVLALAVLIQESWQLSPPASLTARVFSTRHAEREAGQAPARAVTRRLAPDSSPIVITEISTVNHDVILDDTLAPSDWIELYNRADRPLSLAGWRLSESGRPQRGWVLPGITLAPRTHLVVWASGKDRVSGAAGRRVNALVTRRARHTHVVSGRDSPSLEGFQPARRVRVDIAVPEAGDYSCG